MIIHGTNLSVIAKEIIPDKCSNCGKQNCIEMIIFQSYAHVYWIPFYPKAKTGASQCLNCNHILQNNEFTDDLIFQYKTLRKKSKTPLWSFIGICILTVFILYFAIRNNP